VLHTQRDILPNKHFTVSVSGGVSIRPSKRPRLLRPSKITGLIIDNDSDQARVSSDVSSIEGGSGSVPEVSQPQPYCQTASCHESSSSIMSSASDEDGAGKSGPGEQIQQPVTLQWARPSCPRVVEHTHIQEAPEERWKRKVTHK
jgi:hypothetical protein